MGVPPARTDRPPPFYGFGIVFFLGGPPPRPVPPRCAAAPPAPPGAPPARPRAPRARSRGPGASTPHGRSGVPIAFLDAGGRMRGRALPCCSVEAVLRVLVWIWEIVLSLGLEAPIRK